MKVREIQKALDLELAAGSKGLDREVSGGYCGDLLSDVMANSEKNEIWFTIQTHQNILAVAVLKELGAIVLVNGQKPDEDTKLRADEEAVPIFLSPLSAFELAGKLQGAGIGRSQG
ncbi:serine kinase [Thermodesulfobacteriota bacterium]